MLGDVSAGIRVPAEERAGVQSIAAGTHRARQEERGVQRNWVIKPDERASAICTENMPMNHTIMSPATARQPLQTIDSRLHGAWLLIARIAWVAVAALTVVYISISLPIEFRHLQNICTSGACRFVDLTPASL